MKNKRETKSKLTELYSCFSSISPNFCWKIGTWTLKNGGFWGFILLTLFGGIWKLSPSALAQTSSAYWNVERDGSNNLNFYLYNNGTTNTTALQITPSAYVNIPKRGTQTIFTIGDNPYIAGPNKAGVAIDVLDPNIFVESLTGAGGSLNFRIGQGAESGAQRNWLGVTASNGAVTFPGPATFASSTNTYGPTSNDWFRLGWNGGGIYWNNYGHGITADANYLRTYGNRPLLFPYYADSDNAGYFVDPHATSTINGINLNTLYIPNNGTYLSYAGGGTNYLRGPTQAFNTTWYDENNNGYYIDLNNTSVFNNVNLQGATSGAPFNITNNLNVNGQWAWAPVRFVEFYAFGTWIGEIWGSNTGMSYGNGSDYRMKENIKPVTNGLEQVLKLPVRQFDYKNRPDSNSIGFIAHEVQDIVPYAVMGKKDEVDAEGKPRYQSVDYGKFTPILTSAVQELNDKVEDLKKDKLDLEEKLNSLEVNNSDLKKDNEHMKYYLCQKDPYAPFCY